MAASILTVSVVNPSAAQSTTYRVSRLALSGTGANNQLFILPTKPTANGITLTMAKTSVADGPPGAGFVTCTVAAPEFVMSAALIAAVSCIELTKGVFPTVPLKTTTLLLTNPEPFTVGLGLYLGGGC